MSKILKIYSPEKSEKIRKSLFEVYELKISLCKVFRKVIVFDMKVLLAFVLKDRVNRETPIRISGSSFCRDSNPTPTECETTKVPPMPVCFFPTNTDLSIFNPQFSRGYISV